MSKIDSSSIYIVPCKFVVSKQCLTKKFKKSAILVWVGQIERLQLIYIMYLNWYVQTDLNSEKWLCLNFFSPETHYWNGLYLNKKTWKKNSIQYPQSHSLKLVKYKLLAVVKSVTKLD